MLLLTGWEGAATVTLYICPGQLKAELGPDVWHTAWLGELSCTAGDLELQRRKAASPQKALLTEIQHLPVPKLAGSVPCISHKINSSVPVMLGTAVSLLHFLLVILG